MNESISFCLLLMQNLELQFESSPWFILLCILAGLFYAFILYQKKGPWNKKTNYFLAGVRFLLVSILSFLLIGPFVKQIRNTIENPSFVIAVDNSLSIKEVSDSVQLNRYLSAVNNIKNRLSEKEYQVDIYTFQNNKNPAIEEVSFNYPSTDLSQLLNDIQNNYEGKKLGGVVLLSDGIFNLGMSPAYKLYNFPIYSIGIGDTIPKSDINLRTLYYNKITYQGNKFPVVAEITSRGFTGETIEVTIDQNDKVIASKSIQVEEDESLKKVEFILDAVNKGMQHYQVKIKPKDNEYSLRNNIQHAYIDVVEGKEKILIAAVNPHPDIKAIKSSLEKNKNYQVDLFIDGLDDAQLTEILNAGKQDYDLVIMHQVPNRNNRLQSLLNKYINSETSIWFILGQQSDLSMLNRENKVLNIMSVRNETDKVTPFLNNDFSRFNFSLDNQEVMNEFPPVTVPFGQFQLNGNAEVILFQRVGNIDTKKPLLAIKEENGKKNAILVGEGFWQWRLQEYAKNENHKVFDELVLKLVQFLSAKEDRRKFKVYPVKNEFFDSESVIFETEVYNDIYERIYGHNIELQIEDENGRQNTYNYATNENNSTYTISNLPQGVYQYSASTNLDGAVVTSSGEFTIKNLQVELIDFTANHDLLRNLSRQTNGKFFLPDEFGQLEQELINKEVQGVIYASREFLPIINMQWIFFLLLALISTEWFIRKYNSGY